MVHGFVVQSGGRVEVESTLGAGTTFRICLPHAKTWKDDEPTAAPPVTRATAPGTETVLVAEDDESLRFLTRRILRRAGYTVLEARTGDEALAIARRHGGPIHLLLTDLVMPGTGGWRLAEQLTKEQPATRVLYMSAYPDENFLTSSVHGGTIPYLQKPFRPAELLQRVRDLLDTSVARPT
jgi:CheY-like chemotaxis protein